jgi:hypothetical protein
MKKTVIFSVLMASLMIQSTILLAGGRPHGHRYYVRHAKHHKMHKVHRAHGIIDATYQN